MSEIASAPASSTASAVPAMVGSEPSMMKATAAKTMLGYSTKGLCASVSTMVMSEVEPLMVEAVKKTISSAGSARKPTSISRRAPSEPKAVPISIAASARNTHDARCQRAA